jgi:asparagine synthetase B (glutamine-hydrolysing)
LIATVLQKLGNLQEFESRESHLDKLNPFIKEQLPHLKEFIDNLCIYDSGKTYPTSSADSSTLDIDKAAAQLAVNMYSEELLTILERNQESSKTVVKVINCLKKIQEENNQYIQRIRDEQERHPAFLDDYDSEVSDIDMEPGEQEPTDNYLLNVDEFLVDLKKTGTDMKDSDSQRSESPIVAVSDPKTKALNRISTDKRKKTKQSRP